MLLSPEGLSSKRFPDSGTQTQITCFFFYLKTMLAPSLPLTYELPLIKKVVYSGTQSTGGCSHTQTSKLFSAMYRCAALETNMEKVGADKSSHAESGQRWSWISCYTSNLIMITYQNQSSEGTCMDKKSVVEAFHLSISVSFNSLTSGVFTDIWLKYMNISKYKKPETMKVNRQWKNRHIQIHVACVRVYFLYGLLCYLFFF